METVLLPAVAVVADAGTGCHATTGTMLLGNLPFQYFQSCQYSFPCSRETRISGSHDFIPVFPD